MPLLEDRKRFREVLAVLSALSYRHPMPVTESMITRRGATYPVCPRCKISLEREYMNYCNNCGQCLAWESYPYTPEGDESE